MSMSSAKKAQLPAAVARFVEQQETMPVDQLFAEPLPPRVPYAEYWRRAVACMLLSGRVRSKAGGNPNRTDFLSICKEANFDQYLFDNVAGFLVGAHIVAPTYYESRHYEPGKELDAYPHGLWPELGGRWGTDDLGFCGRYDGLLHVRLTALGVYCLGSADTYDMPVEESAGLVKVLPNLELVLVNDASYSPADVARLELFAAPKNERVWRIDQRRILAHIETGGPMDDIRKELESVADNDVPETVSTLLDEIEKEATALKRGRPCILIEVGDAATAALIAHDPGAAKYCLPAGDRHLAVPAKNERAFRTAVNKLGYVLPR